MAEVVREYFIIISSVLRIKKHHSTCPRLPSHLFCFPFWLFLFQNIHLTSKYKSLHILFNVKSFRNTGTQHILTKKKRTVIINNNIVTTQYKWKRNQCTDEVHVYHGEKSENIIRRECHIYKLQTSKFNCSHHFWLTSNHKEKKTNKIKEN